MKPLSFLIFASCWSNVLTADSLALLRLERAFYVDGYSSVRAESTAMRAGGLALIGAVVATLAAHAGELPPEIDRVLTGHGIPATDVSIVVQAVDAASPTLSHLAEVPRSPAS